VSRIDNAVSIEDHYAVDVMKRLGFHLVKNFSCRYISARPFKDRTGVIGILERRVW